MTGKCRLATEHDSARLHAHRSTLDRRRLSPISPIGISKCGRRIGSRAASRQHIRRRDRCRRSPCSNRAAAWPNGFPTAWCRWSSRVAVASIFWRSGQTKVNGFSIREETFFLFREEYKVPLLPPDLAAYLSTIGGACLSGPAGAGLASRLSALGLFGMTLVIQLFVLSGGWPEHVLWFALLGLIIARGPGAISLDHLIWTRRAP